MTKYTATFADGTTISRTTKRAYEAAWRVSYTKDGVLVTDSGFSATRETATPFSPVPYSLHRGLSAKQRAEAKKMNDEFLVQSGYRVEIVTAKIAA
jgi:hypothetical protein